MSKSFRWEDFVTPIANIAMESRHPLTAAL
jgi:hypothetical protein